MKENLKPCVYKQSEGVKARRCTFCRTVRRVIVCGEVKYLRYEAEGKPSLNGARAGEEPAVRRAIPAVQESHAIDPKPGDLPMDRLKRE